LIERSALGRETNVTYCPIKAVTSRGHTKLDNPGANIGGFVSSNSEVKEKEKEKVALSLCSAFFGLLNTISLHNRVSVSQSLTRTCKACSSAVLKKNYKTYSF
jgi:hypothetical protein